MLFLVIFVHFWIVFDLYRHPRGSLLNRIVHKSTKKVSLFTHFFTIFCLFWTIFHSFPLTKPLLDICSTMSLKAASSISAWPMKNSAGGSHSPSSSTSRCASRARTASRERPPWRTAWTQSFQRSSRRRWCAAIVRWRWDDEGNFKSEFHMKSEKIM